MVFSVNSHLFSRRTEINVRQEGGEKKREKEGKKQSTASRLIVNNEKSDLHSRKRLLIFLPMNIRPYPSWSYVLEVELDFVFQSSRFSVNYTRTVNIRQKESFFFFLFAVPLCWKILLCLRFKANVTLTPFVLFVDLDGPTDGSVIGFSFTFTADMWPLFSFFDTFLPYIFYAFVRGYI